MFINIEERECVFVCLRNRQREMAVMRVRYKIGKLYSDSQFCAESSFVWKYGYSPSLSQFPMVTGVAVEVPWKRVSCTSLTVVDWTLPSTTHTKRG